MLSLSQSEIGRQADRDLAELIGAWRAHGVPVAEMLQAVAMGLESLLGLLLLTARGTEDEAAQALGSLPDAPAADRLARQEVQARIEAAADFMIMHRLEFRPVLMPSFEDERRLSSLAAEVRVPRGMTLDRWPSGLVKVVRVAGALEVHLRRVAGLV